MSQVGVTKTGTHQVCAGQGGSAQVRLVEHCTAELGLGQVDAIPNGEGQSRPSEVPAAEICAGPTWKQGLCFFRSFFSDSFGTLLFGLASFDPIQRGSLHSRLNIQAYFGCQISASQGIGRDFIASEAKDGGNQFWGGTCVLPAAFSNASSPGEQGPHWGCQRF